jgi:hypothetical protein
LARDSYARAWLSLRHNINGVAAVSARCAALRSWHAKCTLKRMRAVGLLVLFLVIGCGEDGRGALILPAAGGGAAEVAGADGASAGAPASGGVPSAGGTSGGAAGATSGGAAGNGQGPQPCPYFCQGPSFLEIELGVTAESGGAVSGVQATLTWAEPGSGSSATIATLACAAGTTQTICVPTSDGSPGGYTLEVSAPGFQASRSRSIPARVGEQLCCPAR